MQRCFCPVQKKKKKEGSKCLVLTRFLLCSTTLLCREHRAFVEARGWVRLAPPDVAFVVAHLPADGFAVEMGAGSGHVAGLLRGRGRPVEAFDTQKDGDGHSGFTYQKMWSDSDHTVRRGGPAEAKESLERCASLLLVWPVRDAAYDVESLCMSRAARVCVYIGEDAGGLTGSEAFFAELDRNWILMDRGY